ncbi:MAG: ABC transporter permease [Proteobacteria bacterium]|nr:ABC transporter permease [Pseudomonadota bacterium]MDA1132194.1 ABC transporter permease [Pseudomonadota bacterium]
MTVQAIDAGAQPAVSEVRAGWLLHSLLALWAVTWREWGKFIRQRGRWASALVRPILWLVIFAAGFRSLLGVSIVPPYTTYVTYQEYIIPGLLGIVLLFYGMQSSLSMVYDREMGMMRLLLTAPMPRWALLFFKLMAATFLSVGQAYAFLLITFGFSFLMPNLGAAIPWTGWLYIFVPLFLGGLLLSSLGLLLSVYIRQLENFAGTMNFVIFPMFFVSPALYPLWKLREVGADYIYWVALINPFSHCIELIRFAAYGDFQMVSFWVVIGCTAVFFVAAAVGYDPQRGMLRHIARGR